MSKIKEVKPSPYTSVQPHHSIICAIRSLAYVCILCVLESVHVQVVMYPLGFSVVGVFKHDDDDDDNFIHVSIIK